MKIYIICCVPAQTFYLGKSFVPETWAKMFSANQIFNQPYLQNKSVKYFLHFLHIDTNSHKLKVDQKVFDWAWSKMGVTSLVLRI